MAMGKCSQASSSSIQDTIIIKVCVKTLHVQGMSIFLRDREEIYSVCTVEYHVKLSFSLELNFDGPDLR